MPVMTGIGLGLAGASALAKGVGAAKASGAQSAAATAALAKEQQQAQGARKFQTDEWTQQQANEAPYQQTGTTAANALNSFIGTPFQAPTMEDAENNPGYKFALEQGIGALDKSAAATGNLYSGTQGTALQQYGQGLATQNYQQVYNNAMQEYMNRYNVLSGTTNMGANVAANLGQQGQAAASGITGIDLTTAQQQADTLMNRGAARASGYAGEANAASGAANYFGNYAMDSGAMQAQNPNANTVGYGNVPIFS